MKIPRDIFKNPLLIESNGTYILNPECKIQSGMKPKFFEAWLYCNYRDVYDFMNKNLQ